MEQQVTIPAGDITLEGLVSVPSRPAATGVVVCHPHPLYGGDMQNNVVSALVEAFSAAGHATLRFNFRGVGASGGVHEQGIGEQDDVKAAVGYLLTRQALQNVVVAGYSFGSFVGMMAGAADARVHKLIGVALPVASRDAAFLESVAKPKLIICGTRDSHAPLDRIHALIARMPEPKALEIINGADHFFGGLESEVAAAAVAFIK